MSVLVTWKRWVIPSLNDVKAGRVSVPIKDKFTFTVRYKCVLFDSNNVVTCHGPCQLAWVVSPDL